MHSPADRASRPSTAAAPRMFAPSYSRPPYYPSYLPPDAQELERLFAAQAFMAEHGGGAEMEAWKVAHNVYTNEEKESEQKGADIQKTAQSLEHMRQMMNKANKAVETSKEDGAAANAAANAAATAADPSILVYTDPHAYAHWMERENVTLSTMFSFPSDKWSELKNTPFLRYIYQGMFCLDVGRISEEEFDTAMLFMDRAPHMHTLVLHDSWHTGPPLSKAAAAFKMKSRGHPAHEKKDSLLGGGSAGARMKAGVVKTFPDEKKVLTNLEMYLPQFLARNSHSLVHLELVGLNLLQNWRDIIRLIKRCSNLQRLYLRKCNLGDRNFVDLAPIMKTHLTCLSAIQLAHVDLTAISASLICSLIKVQSENRSTLHWQNHLRQESTPAPSPSILLPTSISSQGLISLDLHGNQWGDKGVSLICETLARDTWIKGIDLSQSGFGEEGLKAVIEMLTENKSLLWIQIQGSREMNTNLTAEQVAAAPTVFTENGRKVSKFAASSGLSSAKLLQKFDPHFGKRAKRLLLLFHQQNIELARFITGRPPPSLPSSDGSPTAAIERKFPSPGASAIFDRFFKPKEAQANGIYGEKDGAGGSKKKTKRKPKAEPEPAPLLSPLIRGLAYRQEQSELYAQEKAKSHGKGASIVVPRAPALSPALNFLFPHISLVAPMDRLMQVDISLRPKPAKIDNSFSVEPHSVSMNKKPRPGANEGTNPLEQAHFDFRPCLKETCVANTQDYINIQKQAYKRRLLRKQERAGMAKIRQMARAVGVQPGTVEEEDEDTTQDDSKMSGGSESVPNSPPMRGAAFTPLHGLVRKVETQLSHLGNQIASDQTRSLAALHEEQDRLAREMERLEQRQREGEARKNAEDEQPDSLSPFQPEHVLHSREVATHHQQQSVADATGFDLRSLSNALSAATQASAASGAPHDPALLAYLEEQFNRLHLYMNMLDQQLGVEDANQKHEQSQYSEATEPQRSQQPNEQRFDSIEDRLNALAQHHHQQQPDVEQHHQQPKQSSSSQSSHHLTHALVERVEQSPSPQGVAGSSFHDSSSQSQAGDSSVASSSHGVVSRGESPVEEQHQQQQQRQFSPEVVEQRSFPREEDLSGASSQQPSEPSLEQPTSSAPAVEAVYSLHAHSAARAAIEDEVEIDEDIQEDLAGEVEERMEEIFGLEKEEEF